MFRGTPGDTFTRLQRERNQQAIIEEAERMTWTEAFWKAFAIFWLSVISMTVIPSLAFQVVSQNLGYSEYIGQIVSGGVSMGGFVAVVAGFVIWGQIKEKRRRGE